MEWKKAKSEGLAEQSTVLRKVEYGDERDQRD